MTGRPPKEYQAPAAARPTRRGMSTLAAPRPMPDPEFYCLPPGYIQHRINYTVDVNRKDVGEYWTPERIEASGRFQYHVYRWAARLVTRLKLKSVLDIGCGVGAKLAGHIAPVCGDIWGFDQPSAVARARVRCPRGAFHVIDLDRPGFKPSRTFDLIICADVIEHLLDPDPVMQLIRGFAHEKTLVMMSTPDRPRVRGRASMGGEKREHVREWSQQEFARFLRTRGLEPLRTRLYPQDDANPRRLLAADEAFRCGKAGTSELSCQAVLCGVTRAN